MAKYHKLVLVDFRWDVLYAFLRILPEVRARHPSTVEVSSCSPWCALWGCGPRSCMSRTRGGRFLVHGTARVVGTSEGWGSFRGGTVGNSGSRVEWLGVVDLGTDLSSGALSWIHHVVDGAVHRTVPSVLLTYLFEPYRAFIILPNKVLTL